MAEISCEMKHKDFYVDTERSDKKSILFYHQKRFLPPSPHHRCHNYHRQDFYWGLDGWHFVLSFERLIQHGYVWILKAEEPLDVMLACACL
jgi:hypothetical protein